MNDNIKLKKSAASMKQLAEQTGIPIQHLKIVKVLFPDGFKTNSGVRADKVIEYYELNKDLVEEIEDESLDSLKKIEKAIKIQTDELDLQEKREQLIHVKDEKEFLSLLITTIQGVLHSKLVMELEIKIASTATNKRGDIGKEIYNEIIKNIQEVCKKRSNG